MTSLKTAGRSGEIFALNRRQLDTEAAKVDFKEWEVLLFTYQYYLCGK